MGFLNHLKSAVDALKSDAIVIFIDVNNQKFGRDSFHQSVSQYLPKFEQYYFVPSGYTREEWTPIYSNNVVFSVPDDLSVTPESHTKSTVVFEYRK
jgi:hypothetical protein